MSSIRLPQQSKVISSWRHQSSKFNDQPYAETVYRTVCGTDGKVKEQFLHNLRELKINQRDLADL
jgi:hypothetical protein